jgi:tetratricopeptide (TPR) repeat protein
MKIVHCVLLVSALLFSIQNAESQVQVHKGTESIPTYQLGPGEPSPIFYTGRGVQGAAGHMYPYPAQISLGDEKTDVTYDMVYLENEYLKVTIIPAFGGKIFSAIDKTNGHEMFHRNSTVKPDLIGTLGAWISGGIEWCFPHHHRTTTLLPADYRIVQHPDGSATVWVGENERNLRLRGVVGITLHPDRSYIDVDYRLTNPNPVTQNFLFWANVAVTADENFRTFWPPSQEIGVFHNNRSFTHWPVSHEVYRGVDYTGGVDLTWWKNHPSPLSFFFWQGEEGFIGGYNYARQAGMVHVGDTYKSRISKLWQFGPGLEGQNARRKLTDDGVAYVELMTGTFSNNQPDYSWFSPHMTKDAKHYWYPIRDIEIVKNATRDAAITLQMRDRKEVFYGVNVTGVMKNAMIVLTYNGQEVVSRKIDVDPPHPFTAIWKSREDIDEYGLNLSFFDENGNEIVAYTPYQRKNPELPEVMEDFRPASEINTPEDLYLTGRWVDQFSRPHLNPDDYYLKALEISPDDYRVNMALGIRRVKQWRFTEAEECLERAARKLKYQYIQPKESELYYYWALAQRAQEKIKEAFRNFSYAAFDYAWYSAANFQLAQMESERGNTEQALKYIDDAYSTNNRDGEIVVLYSALLRKTGRGSDALAMLDGALDFDPLNYALMHEKYLITGQSSVVEMQDCMQDVENNYVEIGINYLNAGLFDDAVRLFSEVQNPENPLFLYYQAFAMAGTGLEDDARILVESAGNKSPEYVFPYRLESEKVLRYAMQAAPSNAAPCYLLGNLLYEHRPEEAIQAWNAAADMDGNAAEGTDGNAAMVWRNLAFSSFYHEKSAEKAIEYLKRALDESPDHPYWYSELVEYYQASDREPEECLAIMDSRVDIVRRDVAAPKGLVMLYNLNGAYDKAIALLDTHHFRTWEGGRDIYWHYVDAHVLKALDLIEEKKYREAMEHLRRGMEYPENLEVGKPLNDERNALIYYVMAQVAERMGNKKEAQQYYAECIGARNSGAWPDLVYYQALSLRKTGRTSESDELLDRLDKDGKRRMESAGSRSGIGVEESGAMAGKESLSEGYYLQGLACLGKGNKVEGKDFMTRSLNAYRYNLWAKYQLQNPGEILNGK